MNVEYKKTSSKQRALRQDEKETWATKKDLCELEYKLKRKIQKDLSELEYKLERKIKTLEEKKERHA